MTPDADAIRSYAADPMAFFADAIIPAAGGVARLFDVWADFQRAAFQVLSDCLQAVAQGRKPPYRGLWIERTKGGSKDSDVGLGLLWLMMFSRVPQTVELGADDQSQILETYKAMQAASRCNPWILDRLTFQRGKIVCEANNSECLFLTRDASGSHGSRPSVTVCNELAHCQDESFIGTMMDNADKVPTNLAIIATNAGHLGSWQHRWRENYRSNPAWCFQKVETVAPWIDAAMVADAQRRNPPGRFKRLWCGQWVAAGGDALPADAIERCIVHTGPQWQRVQHADTICAIGVDAAIANHHAAVVVLTGRHMEGKLRVARVVDLPPPVRLDRIRDEVQLAGNLFSTRCVALDPWQMMRVAEELTAAGYEVLAEHQTGNVLTRQAAALLQAVRDEVLELYPDTLLLEDLYGARIVERSYGQRVELSANEHGHGDRLSAMMQVLPHCLEALGQPYYAGPDDGLGSSIFPPGYQF